MSIFSRLTSLPMIPHGIAVVAGFFGLGAVQARLDALYAQSGHPVDYATGQTTFDAAQIKEYYAAMQEGGTLDVYIRTQQFDFLFLATLGLFGLLLGTFIARFARVGSWGRWFGGAVAIFAIVGASCDAIENIWSFVMLADPQGFAAWLAIPYSGFAVAKFAAITLAMVSAIIAIGLIAVGRATDRPRLG